MPLSSKKLHRARAVKNDEFYTQYEDVRKECDHYRPHFFNKTIYCNCDTADSAFVKYFIELKAAGMVHDVWFSGGLGGADFRSAASVELLKRADIIVTNPPFSLFREFMDLLIEHNKKFLIIGNVNAISREQIFTRIKSGSFFVGTRAFAGGMLFYVPDANALCLRDGGSYKIHNGNVLAVVGATWFTNIQRPQKPFLFLNKLYHGNEAFYPKYDNLDAINVGCKNDIPLDYYGAMGVPITFIDKYNSEQFEILGIDKELTADGHGCRINGRTIYSRIIIRRLK